MEQRQVIRITDFLGLNNRAAENALPVGASPSLYNIEFVKRGWTVRQGFDNVNASSAGSSNIIGIFQGFNHLLVVYAGAVDSLSGSTLTSRKTGLTSGAIPSFCSYNGLDMMVNGSGNDNPQSWDGTTWQDLAGSPPKADHCVVWRNRVFLSGLASPAQCEVQISRLETPTIWDGEFLRPTKRERGGNIICCQVVPFPGEEDGTRLAVFASDRIYHFDGYSKNTWTIYTVQTGIGSAAKNSHVNADGVHYWMDENGFYATTDGGYTVNEISWPIKPTIDLIDKTVLNRVWGVHYRNRKQIWWNVPITSLSSRCSRILVYNYGVSTPMSPGRSDEARHVWSIYGSNKGGTDLGAFTALAEVIHPSTGEYTLYAGEGNAATNGGYVWNFGEFGGDDGTVIPYEWTTPLLLFQETNSRNSIVRKVNIMFDGLSAGGTETMNLDMYSDGSGSSAQTNALTLGTGTTTIRNENSWFNRIVKSAKFKLSGVSGLAVPVRCLEMQIESRPLRGNE